MHDHVAVVKDEPGIVVSALHTVGRNASLSYAELNLSRKSLYLCAGVTRTKNKILGYDRFVLNVKHLYISSLFGVKNLSYCIGKLLCVLSRQGGALLLL